MTKVTIFLLVAALLICHLHIGDAKTCKLSDIQISAAKTGKLVEGQSEYKVTIDNRCSCPQAGVKLRCLNFPSVEPVDGSKIRRVGSQLCLVANGGPITPGSPVTFTYAWKTPQEFTVVSANPRCTRAFQEN
uniref:Uncharacterized protein n=1 Tax=Avena sativa TaxID=4498 RepID=A0ACD5ZW86_AVESA